MREQVIDLWAEHREGTAALVAQLTPAEALEVLERVVAACNEGHQVAPALLGTIRGIVERRAALTPEGRARFEAEVAYWMRHCWRCGAAHAPEAETCQACGALLQPF